MKRGKKVVNFNDGIIRKYVEGKRPPLEIRDKLDLGYTLENQVLEIFEIRTKWSEPNAKIKSSVAKARFIKSRRIWKIYWKRANGNWESYEPNAEVRDLSEILRIIEEDKHGCFWG